MFILTTTMASHSLYWIYSLLFLVAYTLWQPFVAYFRSDIDIIVFFCWAGWKWVGRRECLTKKIFFFTSSGAQRWAEREMGNTKKNTATLMWGNCIYVGTCISGDDFTALNSVLPTPTVVNFSFLFTDNQHTSTNHDLIGKKSGCRYGWRNAYIMTCYTCIFQF